MTNLPAFGHGSAGSLCVVTGAAGFVGAALVQRLLADGHTVRAVVLPNDPMVARLTAPAPSERLQIVTGDVTVYDAIAPVLANATHVFHTAALVHAWAPRSRFDAVNVGGTCNLARAAIENRVGRFVHVSTTDVFGIPVGGQSIDEGSPFRNWDEPYADSKIAAERELWRLHKETGLPLTVIYPGWVYGPGDAAFFPGLAAAIAGSFMLFWKRDVRLPWVYIDNLVDACILASTNERAVGQGYIVHDGTEGPSLQDVCVRIARQMGVPPPSRHVPFAAAYGAAWLLERLWKLARRKSPPPLLTVDVKAFGYQWYLSNEKVRRDLGWTPRVSTEEGMQSAIVVLR